LAETENTDSDFILGVRTSLQAERTDEPSYRITHTGHAPIKVAKDFTEARRSSLVRNVMGGTTNSNKPKLLLGLMEKPDIFARQFRTHVDRKGNILLVDVKKGHLQERFATSGRNATYFPLNVRAKSNFMLGGTNFGTDVLKIKSGKDLSHLIVIRTHIKRPVAKWGDYAHSIVAVVASKDGKALHFPGSARIQQTF
jgi:hypothetical protein